MPVLKFKLNPTIFYLLLFGACNCYVSFQDIYGQKEDNSIFELNKKIDSLREIANSEKDTLYPFYLNKLSYEMAYVNLDSMKLLSHQADSLSRIFNYKFGELEASNNLGDYEMITGNVKQALAIHVRTVEESKFNGFYELAGKSLNSIAYIKNQEYDYVGAYEALNSGIELTEKYGHGNLGTRMKMNLAILLAEIGDYKNAIEEFQQLLKTGDVIGDDFAKGQILSNLAFTQKKNNSPNKALISAKEALKIFEEAEQKRWVSYATGLISEIYLDLNDRENALIYLNKTQKFLSEIEDPLGLSEYYNAKARYALMYEDTDSALQFAINSKDIAQEIGYEEGLVDSYTLISEIYLDQKNYKGAIEADSTARALTHGLDKLNNATRLQIIKSSYELEKSKTEEIMAYQKKALQQQTTLIITLIIVLTLFVVSYLVIKNNQKQKVLNQKLEKANEAKDKLFSIIGHDVKSPINNLIELLELYDNESISEEEILRLLPEIKNNTEYTAFTLNNLLHWSKHQLNGLESYPEEVFLRKSIEKNRAAFTPNLTKKNITLDISIDDQLKAFVDSDHLDIITRNIISNAIKFSNEGGDIKVKGTTRGSHVAMSIEDNGIGMSKKILAAISNGTPGKSKTGTQKEKGTGIGLEITKELVEMNDGSMDIQSSPLRGTDVTILLPKVRS